MTREEAIEYWERFNAEIDELYDICSDVDRDIFIKQREAVEFTISALRAQQEKRSPCDLCIYDPPSSMGGKPCWMCPSAPKEEAAEE